MAVKNLKMLEGVIVDEKKELEGQKHQSCQDLLAGWKIALEEPVQAQELDDQKDKTCHEGMGQKAGPKGTDMPAETIDDQGQETETEGIKEDHQGTRPNQGQNG